jgi:hypothetical protein
MWHVWGEERRIQNFGGKPEGKRQLGRPKLRWEDNVKMDHQELGWTGWSWLRIKKGGGKL